MPFQKLQFKPGVNKDNTDYSNEGSWVETEKVRFRAGFPQKIGGWTKYVAGTIIGTCRGMFHWATSYSDKLIAIGTHKKAYLSAGNVLYDITPIRATAVTTATDNCLETTNTSTAVTINLAGHGVTDTGAYATISGAVAIGGVPAGEINIEHELTYVDASTLTFTSTTAATSTATTGGGTAISIAFQINPGRPTITSGYGFGTGDWARLGWGEGSTDAVAFDQRDWFYSNISNDLVLSVREGAMYYWARGIVTSASASLDTRAVLLSDQATIDGFAAASVPVKVGITLLSQQDKHLIAFGAVPFGSVDEVDYDPLLIRWSSQDSPTQWTPQVTNSAGSIQVSRGSRIVAVLPTRQEILVWTDSNLYTLQFLGTTDVFSLQQYADYTSIISPRAAATANNTTYWMGKDKFYKYDGRVTTMSCTLRQHVFQDINIVQDISVISGTNEEWSEVWWFYASEASDWNDRYVVFNYMENIWYHGSIARTAWMDSSLTTNPLAIATDNTTYNGTLYRHEDGVDDDGSALAAYITSADMDIGDGEHYMLTRRMIPDISFYGTPLTTDDATVTVQVRSRDFPGDAASFDTTDTQNVVSSIVGQHTNEVFIRARARQMALKVSSDDMGVHWRLGAPRIDARQDGKK